MGQGRPASCGARRALLEDAPDTAILGISDRVDDRTVLECLRAGVAGLVEREAGPERLSASLGTLAHGESGYDPDQERAALAIAELATSLPDQRTQDLEYAEARRHLSDDELSAVTWVAITINAFNRVSILSGHPVRPRLAGSDA